MYAIRSYYVLFAHAALADPHIGHLLHDQHAAREGFTLAAAEQGRTGVWIDDWRLEQTGDGYRSVIPAREFVLGLTFQSARPPLLQGDDGYSRKGPRLREASYYYSVITSYSIHYTKLYDPGRIRQGEDNRACE